MKKLQARNTIEAGEIIREKMIHNPAFFRGVWFLVQAPKNTVYAYRTKEAAEGRAKREETTFQKFTFY